MVGWNIHGLKVEVLAFNFRTHDDCESAPPEKCGHIIQRTSQDMDRAKTGLYAGERDVIAAREFGLQRCVVNTVLRTGELRVDALLGLVGAPSELGALFFRELSH